MERMEKRGEIYNESMRGNMRKGVRRERKCEPRKDGEKRGWEGEGERKGKWKTAGEKKCKVKRKWK